MSRALHIYLVCTIHIIMVAPFGVRKRSGRKKTRTNEEKTDARFVVPTKKLYLFSAIDRSFLCTFRPLEFSRICLLAVAKSLKLGGGFETFVSRGTTVPLLLPRFQASTPRSNEPCSEKFVCDERVQCALPLPSYALLERR